MGLEILCLYYAVDRTEACCKLQNKVGSRATRSAQWKVMPLKCVFSSRNKKGRPFGCYRGIQRTAITARFLGSLQMWLGEMHPSCYTADTKKRSGDSTLSLRQVCNRDGVKAKLFLH